MTAHLSPELVGLIVSIGGFAVPPVTSLLKREHWSAQVKQLIAVCASGAVAAAAIAVVDPAAFGLGFASLAALVFAASQGAYGLFRNSAVDSALSSFPHKKAVT